MPYVNNQGIRIYYETEGEGPPLVLMYGITHRVAIWRDIGYVDLLRDDYQLVLIDTRGHGASDKPHDPEAYRLPLLAADVVAVLADLDISRAHYLGYSMGGFIGYGIAKYVPERFYSLIIGGADLPWERSPEGAVPGIEGFKLREGTEAFIARLRTMAGPWWTPELEARERSNDLGALAAMLSTEEGIYSHGFEDVVPTLTLPCLFFVGEVDDDPVIRQCVEAIPNATYVSFSGLSHVDAWCRTDLVLPHIRKFLAKVGES